MGRCVKTRRATLWQRRRHAARPSHRAARRSEGVARALWREGGGACVHAFTSKSLFEPSRNHTYRGHEPVAPASRRLAPTRRRFCVSRPQRTLRYPSGAAGSSIRFLFLRVRRWNDHVRPCNRRCSGFEVSMSFHARMRGKRTCCCPECACATINSPPSTCGCRIPCVKEGAIRPSRVPIIAAGIPPPLL